MSALEQISVVVLTRDEEINLPSCLESLRWCTDVVVLDSFSRDRTEEIARAAGATFVQHAFQGFGSQRNWALESLPLREWVLFLDADERVPPELVASFERALTDLPERVAAFRMRRRFHMWGRWLRHSSLYPTWVVRLVRRGRVRYVDRGHAETQEVDGETTELDADLIDENLKGLEAWFERQNRYSTREAAHELSSDGHGLPAQLVKAIGDPLERRALARRLARGLPLRGAWYFLYAWLLRGGFRDGRDGLAFCMMRAIYEEMIAIKKYDQRRGGR